MSSDNNELLKLASKLEDAYGRYWTHLTNHPTANPTSCENLQTADALMQDAIKELRSLATTEQQQKDSTIKTSTRRQIEEELNTIDGEWKQFAPDVMDFGHTERIRELLSSAATEQQHSELQGLRKKVEAKQTHSKAWSLSADFFKNWVLSQIDTALEARGSTEKKEKGEKE